jgi:recombination protein RecT
MGEQSTALTVKEIHGFLDRADVKRELQKALPKHMTPDRLVRLAATMIQKSPKLKLCTPLSLLACVVECAQLGLEPDNVLGEIYLVPFKNTATVIVGYKGFVKLITNVGDVYKITSHVVRKGEKFTVTYGTREEIEHVPKDHGVEKDDATWIGVYAIAHFRDGHTTAHYLERAEVFRRRSRSRAFTDKKTDSPWFTDPESMWMKTAIRAAAAWMPKSAEDKRLTRAIAIDDLGEAGLLTPTAHGFEMAEEVIPELADPANGGDLQEAREHKKGKKSAKLSAPKGESGIPKSQIPGDAIDVKPEKPKEDPVIGPKELTEIYDKGTRSGWKVDEIREWVRKKFGCQVKELRRSMFPEVIKAMESGA